MARRRLTTEEFVERAKSVHGNLYDYSVTEYSQIREKVEIHCCRCDETFEQLAYNHLCGAGCNKCASSKGERAIKSLLDEMGEEYVTQAVFDGCYYLKALRFDFYLPHHQLLIEYDGIQHRRPIDFFGGRDGYRCRKKRDAIKNRFAEDNGIDLIRLKSLEHIQLGVLNEFVGNCIASSIGGAASV